MASILFIAFRRGVLRAVFRGSKSTYEQLLKKANLKSLYERRLQDKACMMFKVRHDLCPPTVKTLFSLKSSTYNLRAADFHIPRFNTVAYGRHSLRYIGPNQCFIVILIFIFVNYNLQGPTENRQGEWVPWINIIIIITYAVKSTFN